MSDTRELTLMFYFASDNPLAPAIVSQLKALKEAGFHPEANVVVHFDPNTENTPAHIFDVNRVNKIRAAGKAQIGFPANPPIVRNLVEDRIWGRRKNEVISAALQHELGDKSLNYFPPEMPAAMCEEQDPKDALQSFLEFCRKHYPARHYMLFILGHGLVVGDNLFLFDEHAKEHSLSLKDFAVVLRSFKRKLAAQQAQFQLLSFSSCSMGGLEVAYELQGTANYMLAAQGPSFVGNWPYTQILVSIFNQVGALVSAENGTQRNGNKRGAAISRKESTAKIFKRLVKEIWSLSYLTSYDFQLAGYSFDVCLCDLNKVSEIKTPLRKLSTALIKGLSDPLTKERILLAHWDAQSFWQDRYTDLYDFCFRLQQRCEDAKSAFPKTNVKLESIQKACGEVMRLMTSGDDKLVVASDFTGPAYQFSHGLFVLFPWSPPNDKQFWRQDYPGYRFEDTSWRKFLDQYFQATMRQPRGSEQHASNGFRSRAGLDEFLLENITARDFNFRSLASKGDPMSAQQQKDNASSINYKSQPGGSNAIESPSELGWFDWLFSWFSQAGNGKTSGEMGSGSGSSSIKNYPPDTRGK